MVFAPPLKLEDDTEAIITLMADNTTALTLVALWSARAGDPVRRRFIDSFSHSAGDRTRERFPRPLGGGYLHGIQLVTDTGIKRGQTYAEIGIGKHATSYIAARGYVYFTNPLVDGVYESSIGGRGHLRWLAVATNEDGDNDTTLALAITNGRRKVRELLLYYTCSTDVANRTMILVFQKGALAQPTGYGAGAVDYQWQSPTLTLTASEDGQLVVGPSIMFQSQNDNGSIAFSNNSTVPHPLPRWIEENDLVELFVNISLGETADKYSCYALVEDWVEV